MSEAELHDAEAARSRKLHEVEMQHGCMNTYISVIQAVFSIDVLKITRHFIKGGVTAFVKITELYSQSYVL
jgi:hypothetical protein